MCVECLEWICLLYSRGESLSTRLKSIFLQIIDNFIGIFDFRPTKKRDSKFQSIYGILYAIFFTFLFSLFLDDMIEIAKTMTTFFPIKS